MLSYTTKVAVKKVDSDFYTKFLEPRICHDIVMNPPFVDLFKHVLRVVFKSGVGRVVFVRINNT